MIFLCFGLSVCIYAHIYVYICVYLYTHTYICGSGQGIDTILNLTIVTYFESTDNFSNYHSGFINIDMKACQLGLQDQVCQPSCSIQPSPARILLLFCGWNTCLAPILVSTPTSSFLKHPPPPSLLSSSAHPPRPLLKLPLHQSSFPEQSAQLWLPCPCCPALSGAAPVSLVRLGGP